MKTIKLSLVVIVALCMSEKLVAQESKSFDEYCLELGLGCEDEDSYELILLAYYDCIECAQRIMGYTKCTDNKYFGIFIQKEGVQSKKLEFSALFKDTESCITWKEVSATDLLKLSSHVTGEEAGPYAISVYKGRLVGIQKI